MLISLGKNRRGLQGLVAILALCAFTCAAAGGWWNNPDFTAKLRRAVAGFAGPARGNYFVPNALVADEINEAWGGPPEPMVDEADGTRLVAGARYHSADEKVAVILDRNGRVVSAGLIHFSCQRNKLAATQAKGERVQCRSDPLLTIFRRGEPQAAAEQTLKSWADGHDPGIQVEVKAVN